MKPRRLTMEAFGPYAGTVVLDFDTLPPGALFLVHGPTGAGKTTVLDAMCVALYGESSGDERDGSSLRSHLAEADQETAVTFDFDLGTDRYRVVRQPKQTRPKKRGEGETTQQPKAELITLDPAGTEIAHLVSGDSKVTAHIEGLLHLEGAQFRQVVVLPQGRFRELLTAGSSKREEILQRLFQTMHYEAIELRLKQRAAKLGAALREQLAKEDEVTGQAAALLELPADAARTLPDLRAAWNLHDAHLTEAKDTAARAIKAEAAAQKLLAEAKETEQRFVELTLAEAEWAKASATTEAASTWREELAAAGRAAPLAPLLDAAEAATQRAATARAEHKQSQATRVTLAARAEAAAAALAATQTPAALAALERAREAASKLEGQRRAVAELAAQTQQAVEATKAVETAAARIEVASADTAAAAQQVASAQATLDEASRAAERLPDLEARVVTLRQTAVRHRRLEAAAAAEAAATVAWTEAERLRIEADTAAATAAAAAQAMRTLREQTRAALLAQGLVADAPCPVCGSREHPAPARSDATPPSDAELEASERVAQDAAEALRTAAAAEADALRAKDVATQTTAGLREDLAPEAAGSAEAEDALAKAHEVREAAHAASTAQPAHAAALATARTREQTAALALEAARAVHTEAIRAEAKASQIVATRQAEVPEALRIPAALEAAIAEAQARCVGLERTATDARAARDAAREELAASTATCAEQARAETQASADAETSRRTLEAARIEAGFPDEEAARTALRDEAAREALANRIEAHAAALRAATDRVSRAREAATDRVRPDLAALSLQAEQLGDAARAAATRRDQQDERLRTVGTLLADLEARAKARAAEEATYAVVGALAKAAAGDNPARLGFQRFVLAALLDEVLLVASERLLRMSNGRYRLQRIRETADRRRVAGLDLEVQDEWHGTTRPAATLSGGEGFLAALALALATADVVQRHAGGIHLDAIFIDEGFGSLDEESLEMAVKTLLQLGEGGRLVGVISHVPALREQIPCRLEVTGGPQGSHARFVVP